MYRYHRHCRVQVQDGGPRSSTDGMVGHLVARITDGMVVQYVTHSNKHAASILSCGVMRRSSLYSSLPAAAACLPAASYQLTDILCQAAHISTEGRDGSPAIGCTTAASTTATPTQLQLVVQSTEYRASSSVSTLTYTAYSYSLCS